MFKDSNLLCWKEESLRQPHASLDARRLKEDTPSKFLTLLISARSCHFGGVYTTRQVWKSRSVQFLRYSGVRHTDRHFSKPFTVTLPKREGQLYYIIERCPLLLKVTPVIIELMKRCEVLRGAHCYS